ncbi:hypothetical protein [Massilia sp. S19_KUP03_FR1]|uniref:hypothetical protein n=1 Tax=Massilia sp. S19_KUP03_FR1 TaxID=3025503 RepID=UPI002FCD60A4
MKEAFPALVVDGATPYTSDTAHQAGFAYLPYLLTGDFYYLEELQFWAMYNALIDNPGYRKYEKGLFQNDQLRGQGWSMRTLGEAAYITPDNDKFKAQFLGFLNANLDWYNATYTNGTNNNLGMITNGYGITYQNNTAGAPWQDDHFTSAIGHVAELGFAKAGPLLAWKAKFQIGRMMDPAFCWIDAALYNVKIRDGLYAPFYATLGQVYSATVDARISAQKCNTPEQLAFRTSAIVGSEFASTVLGDMVGNSNSTVGYASNFQPAHALTVDSGAPGGAAAWKKFIGRAVKTDYRNGPQFAILPRAAGSKAACGARRHPDRRCANGCRHLEESR